MMLQNTSTSEVGRCTGLRRSTAATCSIEKESTCTIEEWPAGTAADLHCASAGSVVEVHFATTESATEFQSGVAFTTAEVQYRSDCREVTACAR
jgi:hypothetical protein